MKHIRIVLSLLVVVVVFISAVFLVESWLRPQINARLAKEANIAKFEVLPSLEGNFEEDHEFEDSIENYDVEGLTITKIFIIQDYGYVYEAVFQGYQSQIKYVLGISEDGEITGFNVLEQADTPGLGGEIANPEYWEQFEGMSFNQALSKEIDSKSGASITGNAWKDSVAEIVDYHINTVLGYEFVDVTNDVTVPSVTKAEELQSNGTPLEVTYTVTFQSEYSDGVDNEFVVTYEIGEGIKSLTIVNAADTDVFGAHIADPEFAAQFPGMSLESALNGEYDDLGGATYPVTLSAFTEVFEAVTTYHEVTYEGGEPDLSVYTDVTGDVDVDGVTKVIERSLEGTVLDVTYTFEFESEYSSGLNVIEVTFEIENGIKELAVITATDTSFYGAHIADPEFAAQFVAMSLEAALNGEYDDLGGATYPVTLASFTDVFEEVVTYHGVAYEGVAPDLSVYTDVTDDVDVNGVTEVIERSIEGTILDVTYTFEFESQYSSGPNVVEITFEIENGIKELAVITATDTSVFGAHIADPEFAAQFVGMALQDAIDRNYDDLGGATYPITLGAFTEVFDRLLAFHNVEYEGAAPETHEEMIARYKEEVSVAGGTFVDVTGDYDITDTFITMIEEVTPSGATEASHLVISFTFPGLYSDIESITGVNLDTNKLNGLRIVSENETDGIGDRILEEDFLAQFDDLSILGAKYGVYDAIGGASMTTGSRLTAGFENIITWLEIEYLGTVEEPPELTEAQQIQQTITNWYPTQFSIADISSDYTLGNDVEKVIRINDIDGLLLGYVFIAEGEGASYSEPTTIRYMIGIGPDSTFTGFKMLEDNETPGKADPYYLITYAEQFLGLDIEELDYDIDAVAGSTVTHNKIMASAELVARFFVETVMGGVFNRPDPETINDAELTAAFSGTDNYVSIYVQHPYDDSIVNIYEAYDGTTLMGHVYVYDAEGIGGTPIRFAWGVNLSGTTQQINVISQSETWQAVVDCGSYCSPEYDGSDGIFPNTPWLAAQFNGIILADLLTTATIDDIAGVSTTTGGMRDAAINIAQYHEDNVGGGS